MPKGWTSPLCYKYSCFKKHRTFQQPPNQVIAHILPPGRELISRDLKLHHKDSKMTAKPWGGQARSGLEQLKDSSSSELEGEGGDGREWMLSPQYHSQPAQQKTQRGIHHSFQNAPRVSVTKMPFYTNPVVHPTPQRSSNGRRRKTPEGFPRPGHIPNHVNLGKEPGALATAFLPPPNTRTTPNTKIPSEISDKMYLKKKQKKSPASKGQNTEMRSGLSFTAINSGG